MRYHLYTFKGSWLQTPGRNIELYYTSQPLSHTSEIMTTRPKEPMGDTGAYVMMSGDIPVIFVPESSYLFNYHFMQGLSPIRSLARKMPVERSLISALDGHIYGLATIALDKLKKHK